MSKQGWIVIAVALIIIIGLIVIAQKGGKEVSQPQTEINMDTPTASSSGELKIEDLQIGTGSAGVKIGDNISINYRGTLTDGTEFDSSYKRNQPFETQIGVGQVIQGWDQGVIGMKVGGKRKLTIPPELGYGSRGAGTIPPNSTLIFEVELMGIN